MSGRDPVRRAVGRHGWFARRRRRVLPSLSGITLGLAGLGQTWRAAMPVLREPQAVPDGIFILTAVVWLVLVVAYAVQGPRTVLADLRDPVWSPFVPVPLITAMILAAALAVHAFAAGRVLVIIFLALTIAVGGWVTGQWIVGDLDENSVHPGYLLPTVAGGLVGASAAAGVHLHALGEASFGIGVICWAMLGSLILNRLFFRRALPAALVPTLAIEVGPPALAGIAYFTLTGGTANFIAYALGGYTVLMVFVQVRLIPLYARLKFGAGFWAFTFPSAAAATLAMLWIAIRRPPGGTAYAIVIVTVLTVFIAVIAARTVAMEARGQLFAVTSSPAPPVRPAPPVPATDARPGVSALADPTRPVNASDSVSIREPGGKQ